jgi:hypothetical protein
VFSFSTGKSDNSADWFNASAQLGCSGSDAGQSLDCMRTKSYQQILAASFDPNPLSAILGNFGPTPDGKVVFTQNQYKLRQLAGQFIKRPYLTGTNHYEAGLFRLFAQATNTTIPDIDWCLFDLAIFTCPAARSALGRALALVPSYRYRYYGQFPNLRLTKKPNSGAWHGSEIALIWGTVQESTLLAESAIETQIGKYLQTAWASFAKNPDLAFTKLPHKFPVFNDLSTSTFDSSVLTHEGASLINFAKADLIVPTFHLPEETDGLCPIMEAIEDLIPGGLASLVTSGGSGLGALGGSGLSGLLANSKLKGIPNFQKLTTNYQKYLNLPIPSECPLLLG